MEHIDEVIFSLKAVSDDIYRDYTGCSNQKTLENLVTVFNSGKKLQAECLLIPGYIDTHEIESLARFIASINRDIPLRIGGYYHTFVIDGPMFKKRLQILEAAKVFANGFWFLDITRCALAPKGREAVPV